MPKLYGLTQEGRECISEYKFTDKQAEYLLRGGFIVERGETECGDWTEYDGQKLFIYRGDLIELNLLPEDLFKL